jgi:hypothetical protein
MALAANQLSTFIGKQLRMLATLFTNMLPIFSELNPEVIHSFACRLIGHIPHNQQAKPPTDSPEEAKILTYQEILAKDLHRTHLRLPNFLMRTVRPNLQHMKNIMALVRELAAEGKRAADFAIDSCGLDVAGRGAQIECYGAELCLLQRFRLFPEPVQVVEQLRV